MVIDQFRYFKPFSTLHFIVIILSCYSYWKPDYTTFTGIILPLTIQVLESKRCWKYNRAGELNWTLIYNNTENSCIFVVLQQVFPWGVYGWTISHVLLDIMLCCGSIYRSHTSLNRNFEINSPLPKIEFFRSNVVVLLYLTIDAAHLGLLASIWSMSFLTERMPRMLLMIFLFPLISFGLCAWMAVFGFYLRLEEAAWAR